MKTRERLKRIQQSKSWTERLALARDHVPGTKFDWLIPHLMDSLRYLKEHPEPKRDYMKSGLIDIAGLASDDLRAFGYDLAQAVQSGNSTIFRDWAKAIDAWYNHEPQADKLREAMIQCCIPPTATFTMRKVHAELERRGIVLNEAAITASWRIARELGIKIKGKPGRPRKCNTTPRKRAR